MSSLFIIFLIIDVAKIHQEDRNKWYCKEKYAKGERNRTIETRDFDNFSQKRSSQAISRNKNHHLNNELIKSWAFTSPTEDEKYKRAWNWSKPSHIFAMAGSTRWSKEVFLLNVPFH